MTFAKEDYSEEVHMEDEEDSVNSDDFEPDEYMSESNDSDYDEEMKHRIDEIDEWDWSIESSSQPPHIPKFSRKNPVVSLGKDAEPISIFFKIFDENLMSNFVTWTNQYANRTSNHKRRQSHEKLWSNTSVVEMKAFIGTLIAMSLVKKANLKDYWKTSRLLSTPGITRTDGIQ